MTVIYVEETLNTHLATFASSFSLQIEGIVNMTSIDVAYQNIPYSPKNGIPYLQAWFLNGETAAAALGSCAQNRHTGLYQIDIVVPNGQGNAMIKPISDGLESIFRRGSSISGNGFDIKVISSNLEQGITAPDTYINPFTVSWRADLNNN